MVASKEGPVFVITGITGLQGGSVLSAVEASNEPYHVKGLTRDASKEKAQAIAKKGVEMVEVDLVKGNEDQVTKAFQGADYVFYMTNYWEHLDKQREIDEGKMAVDCAKKAGVKTFIYSSLPSYANQKDSKYQKVDHFEGKAEINAYAKKTLDHYVSVQAAMYSDNFQKGFTPRKQEDGSFAVFMPEGFSKSTLTMVNVQEDYGKFVVGAIESGKKHGEEIYAHSHRLNGQEIVDVLTKESDKQIGIIEVPHPVFKQALAGQMGDLVATDLTEMMGAHFDMGYYPYVSGEELDKHNSVASSKTASFQEYAKTQDWSKIIA